MIVCTMHFTYSKKTLEFNILTFCSVFVCKDTIQIDFVMGYTGVYNIYMYIYFQFVLYLFIDKLCAKRLKQNVAFTYFKIILLLA